MVSLGDQRGNERVVVWGRAREGRVSQLQCLWKSEASKTVGWTCTFHYCTRARLWFWTRSKLRTLYLFPPQPPYLPLQYGESPKDTKRHAAQCPLMQLPGLRLRNLAVHVKAINQVS